MFPVGPSKECARSDFFDTIFSYPVFSIGTKSGIENDKFQAFSTATELKFEVEKELMQCFRHEINTVLIYKHPIGGLHMTSSKTCYANYDGFVPNFDMAYKTIKRFSVANLKSFRPTKTEL